MAVLIPFASITYQCQSRFSAVIILKRNSGIGMGLESFIPGGGQILDFFRGSQKDFPG